MPKAAASLPGKVTRRSALKALGASAGAVVSLPWLSEEGLLAFSRIQQTNAAPDPRVLSPSQFTTVETLAELIIPPDDRSPGAKEARVADYIDLLLSEADHDLVLQWFGGLAAVEAEAVARFGIPFSRLDAGQADAILREISRNELSPTTPLATFFVMNKRATIHGYYTSDVGIHQELHYKGNQFLRQFVGCQTEDGQDCPHCGQKSSRQG